MVKKRGLNEKQVLKALMNYLCRENGHYINLREIIILLKLNTTLYGWRYSNAKFHRRAFLIEDTF